MHISKYNELKRRLNELRKEIVEDGLQSPLEDNDKQKVLSATDEVIKLCEMNIEMIECMEQEK